MKKSSIIAVIGIVISLAAFLTQASAFTLPDPTSTLAGLGGAPASSHHGDFYSYSLPVLALNNDILFDGGVGPGSPYYVDSTPGAIQDDIVIATGVNGGPTVDNSPLGTMDNAYETPSGVSGSPTFSTQTSPDPAPSFTGDAAGTWDVVLSDLNNYLAGSDLIFFFNHNEENRGSAADQALYGWGRISLVDLENPSATQYFYFANPGNTTYTQYEPNADNYVYAPGQITIGPHTINHNLGANQAAYAMTSPDLNALLNQASVYDIMRVELRLRDLSNGYEQLFIQRGDVTNIVPEPSSLILLGTGLLGVFGLIRRKK